MHIILMLVLVIAGFAAGENISWLLGLPMICIGLYVGFGDWGGKKGARQRSDSEALFFLIGLASMGLLILGNLFNW